MKIAIATPMYNSLCSMDYMISIEKLKCLEKQCEFVVHTIGNESLITRARNNMLTEYYVKRKEFDYLMFWDADIGIEPDSVFKLIKSGKDVIGAPVRLKNKSNHLFSVTPKLDENGKVIKDGSLLEVVYFATGIMLLSTKAVEDLVEYAKKEDDVYTNFSNTMKIDNTNFIYDIFKIGIKDKSLPYEQRIYLSEDYWVCNTLNKIGYKLYIDESIDTRHYGSMCFAGSDGVIKPETYINREFQNEK